MTCQKRSQKHYRVLHAKDCASMCDQVSSAEISHIRYKWFQRWIRYLFPNLRQGQSFCLQKVEPMWNNSKAFPLCFYGLIPSKVSQRRWHQSRDIKRITKNRKTKSLGWAADLQAVLLLVTTSVSPFLFQNPMQTPSHPFLCFNLPSDPPGFFLEQTPTPPYPSVFSPRSVTSSPSPSPRLSPGRRGRLVRQNAIGHLFKFGTHHHQSSARLGPGLGSSLPGKLLTNEGIQEYMRKTKGSKSKRFRQSRLPKNVYKQLPFERSPVQCQGTKTAPNHARPVSLGAAQVALHRLSHVRQGASHFDDESIEAQ